MSFKAFSERGRPESVLFVFWINALRLALLIRTLLLSPPIPSRAHKFLIFFLEPVHQSRCHIRLHLCNRCKSTLKVLLQKWGFLPSRIPEALPFFSPPAIITFFPFLNFATHGKINYVLIFHLFSSLMDKEAVILKMVLLGERWDITSRAF